MEFNVKELMVEYEATEAEIGAAIGLMYLNDPGKNYATIVDTNKRKFEIYDKIAEIEQIYQDELDTSYMSDEKYLRKECRTFVKKLCTRFQRFN